ncbi:RICIN domain-containing protein [Arcticibacter tournemirensis]
MKIIIKSTLALVFIGFIVMISFRVRKDIKKKLQFENTYAIQNVATRKALRPLNANYQNGVEIISYPLQDWECITWEFIEIDKNTFLLKDLYTEKTFQPKFKPGNGVGLCQQSLGGSSLQYWEFIKQVDETYLIRLKGTDLYITASSDKTDSPIVLKAKSNDKKQFWKKVKQTPWI